MARTRSGREGRHRRRSPKRNVNEIRAVRNTNHAPATNFNGLHAWTALPRQAALFSGHAPVIACRPPSPIDPYADLRDGPLLGRGSVAEILAQ